jgi:3-oxoacyl-[acyl-carrier-protein] synthase II
MDRLSALAVAAAGELLEVTGRHSGPATGEGAAFVLGTTAGSAKSMMDITRDTLTREMPFHIDTARIPNAIMNSAAAQCAIWYGLQGPNATVAGGRVAALFALRYAQRLLAAGRALSVICGGAEELTPERAWLEFHGRGDEPTAPLGEGCALLLVEPFGRGEYPLAEVLAVELGVYEETGLATAMSGCVARALRRARVPLAEVWAVSAAGAGGQPDGVPELLRGHGPLWLPGDGTWGDAGAASAAFQIASVLAAAERASGPGDRRFALITSADRDGVLGCAVLRLVGEG